MRPVLLVTGSTGIAAETAVRAAAEFGVFVVGLEEASCRELSERVAGSGYMAGDLRDERVSDEAVLRCVEHHGRLDALFNVAGISGRSYGDGPLHECTAEGWDRTMESNVRTMFLMSRAVLRHWSRTETAGAILNMTSVLASSPEPEHFATHAYAASKGAVVALTRSMAAYYARYGIRVNAIAPGLVATPMSARAQADPEVREFIGLKQPLAGGVLEAGEVAEAALFLLSGRARHVTGAVLNVDGGWSVS